MQTRRDIELQIANKFLTLPAVDLQWLAEDIARIRDRHRYRNLSGKGRNVEAQTTKGWPDAYVVSADGTVDGVEATRARSSWSQHLETDIKNANDPDKPYLNGYLFVAGYPDHEPEIDELSAWERRFCELGIPKDRIDLLIGMALVAELLEPRYARTLQTILGLSQNPEYFEMVRQNAVPGSREWAFQPKASEFLGGLVHRPALTDIVEDQLGEDGHVLIRGRGAAGKSVLAHLVATGPAQRVLPSYYLNIAPHSGQIEPLRGKINNTLVDFGGEGLDSHSKCNTVMLRSCDGNTL